MAATFACPDLARFQLQVFGQLPSGEKEALLQHLESCAACAQRFNGLSDPDTLVELVRKVKTLGDGPAGEKLGRLIETMLKMRPGARTDGGKAKTLPPTPSAPQSLTFRCSGCNKSLKVKADLAGKKVKCPQCGIAVPVPAEKPTLSATPSAINEDKTRPPMNLGEDVTVAPRAAPDKMAQTSPSGVPFAQPTTTGDWTAAGDGSASIEEKLDFLAPAQGPDEIGRLGTYRILKKLGAGGMGMVFLAEDTLLRRKVALKTMLPNIAVSPQARERFLREARAAAAIEHSHIVAIYQVGEDNGVPFLAMPFLKGQPLDERLKLETRLPEAEALRIAAEMADGLAAAHAQGLIHRDIKPGNVWLESNHEPRPSGSAAEALPDGRGSSGHVKLLDFGLARAEGDTTHLTQSGAIVGTPAFMAPEQARNEAIDGRADLFSLGCVLYAMLTGQRPFHGDTTMALLSALALDTPEEPHKVNPAVSPAVSAFTMRLLAKKAADRVATARAASEELRRLARAEDGTETTGLPPNRLRQRPGGTAPPRRRRWLIAAGLLGAAVLLAGIIVIIRDKMGKEVARVVVPNGGSAEVTDDKKGDPRPVINPPGAEESPLYPGAFVRHPARIDGVRGWTIANRHMPTYRWRMPQATSPDGRYLAISDPHGPVTVWKMQAGELHRILGGSAWEVRGLAWSKDSKMLAACGDDPTALLWDVDTGKRLPAPTLPNLVFAVAWSPDSQFLAFACADKAVNVWERTTNEMLPPLKDACHGMTPVELGWAPNSNLIICAGGNAPLILRSVLPPRRQINFEYCSGHIERIAWSPNGDRLAVFASDYGAANSPPPGIRIFDAATGKSLLKIEKAGLPFRSLDADSAFRWLDAERIVVSARNKIAIVEAASGKLLGITRDGLEVKDRFISEHGTFFTAIETKYDRLSFYTLDPENPIDTEKQLLREKKLFTPKLQQNNISHLAWSPDGKTLATGGWYSNSSTLNPTICLWDMPTGAVRTRDVGMPVQQFTWSPDGKRLGIMPANNENQVRIWDIGGTGELQKKGSTNYSHSISPDLTYYTDGRLSLHAVETGKKRYSWKLPGNQNFVPLFSPDGKTLAAWASGPDLKKDRLVLYDLTSGKEIGSFEIQKAFAGTPAAWSPDGKYLVCGGGDDSRVELDIFDVPNRCYIQKKFEGDLKGSRRGVAWSPDGKVLAATDPSGGNVGQVRLWDFETGKLRPVDKRLRGWGVSFSPDGKTLAVHRRIFVAIWDWQSGTYRGTLLPLGADGGVAISPDGHYRATSKEAEQQIVYVVETDKGQELLTTAEFAAKYGWTNDPSKVRLVP